MINEGVPGSEGFPAQAGVTGSERSLQQLQQQQQQQQQQHSIEQQTVRVRV
jgi:hypothetical protein